MPTRLVLSYTIKFKFSFLVFAKVVYFSVINAKTVLFSCLTFCFSYLFRTFAPVMRQILTLIILISLCQVIQAQEQQLTAEQVLAEMDSPTFVPTVKVGKVLHEGDSIQYMEMNHVYVYPQLTFKNRKQADSYMRLVKNVKKVLPIAKEARQMLIETTEFLETLPDQKAKDEHIKRVEDDIFRTYKPKMKKLTYSQGKLLIKLIDRECHSSSYDMIKAFMGPIRAGFWQVFAWGFGASLKKEYDAEGVDRLTERVVLMVEAGQI